MYNIGVIGDYNSICGFCAVGFSVFPADSAEQARKLLNNLANSDYGIIYMTEPLMDELQAECDKYNEQTIPCIIPIPSCVGTTGFGESRLKAFVERAVGSDIIFND